MKNIENDDKIFDKILADRNDRYNRIKKVKNFLKNNNFDSLIGRLILEHDDNYRDKCYKNGYEPYPNNKLTILFELIQIEGEEIEKIDFKNDTHFKNTVYKYKNYYFQFIYGQGTITKIYDQNHENIFSI